MKTPASLLVALALALPAAGQDDSIRAGMAKMKSENTGNQAAKFEPPAKTAPAGSGWAATKEGKEWMVKHSESGAGWHDEWTSWLAEGIGGYAGKDGTTWDRISMKSSFFNDYCPGYNKMSSDEKREFIIELFKVLAKAESDWNPNSVNRANPSARGLYQMSGTVDMGSCQEATHAAPDPLNPKSNILCAVLKLMPVFFWEHTFSADTYGPQGTNIFFESLQTRNSASTLRSLKDRVPESVPACKLK